MTLPKDVAAATGCIDRTVGSYIDIAPKWQTIRTHLLDQGAEIERLARNNTILTIDLEEARRRTSDLLPRDLRAAENQVVDAVARAERAESELAKLRARIDAAVIVRVELINKMGGVRCNGLPIEWVGKRVALVRVEDES